jgi:hypothetical protein
MGQCTCIDYFVNRVVLGMILGMILRMSGIARIVIRMPRIVVRMLQAIAMDRIGIGINLQVVVLAREVHLYQVDLIIYRVPQVLYVCGGCNPLFMLRRC